MKKKVMVVDDSALMRRVMCDIINSESSFEVIDLSRDGQEAYEKILVHKYDAIVLDINMPRMDGLELLRKLQREHIDVVVIMASSLTTEGSEQTLEALELGAIDFVTKPGNIIEARGEDFANSLLNVLCAVLKVNRTGRKSVGEAITTSKPQIAAPTRRAETSRCERSGVKNGNKLVALACSTGGPQSLQKVIPLLPADMNAPMVLVQHMPAGFTKTLANRLNELSKVTVSEAADGDILKKGHVYIAPGGKHIKIQRQSSGNHVIKIDDSPAVAGLKPCADIMYESLVNCGYDEIVCVVLTGMGADGTKGITTLKEKKPIFTISQDEDSCVVYGMPRAIYEAGISNKVVPLKNVASTIIMNVGVQ